MSEDISDRADVLNPPANPAIPDPVPSVDIPALVAEAVANALAAQAASNASPVPAITPVVEPVDKDAQIEALKAQLLAAQGGTVKANTRALSMSDAGIELSQIEPGIKWALQQGLVNLEDLVSKYGDHLKETLAPIVGKL